MQRCGVIASSESDICEEKNLKQLWNKAVNAAAEKNPSNRLSLQTLIADTMKELLDVFSLTN